MRRLLIGLVFLSGCGEEIVDLPKTPPVTVEGAAKTPLYDPPEYFASPQVTIVVTPRELIAANLRTVASRIDNGRYRGDLQEILLDLRRLNWNLGVMTASYEGLFKEMQDYLYKAYREGEMTKESDFAVYFRKLANMVEKQESLHELVEQTNENR